MLKFKLLWLNALQIFLEYPQKNKNFLIPNLIFYLKIAIYLPSEASNSNTSFTINQVNNIVDCPSSSSSSSFTTIQVSLHVLNTTIRLFKMVKGPS